MDRCADRPGTHAKSQEPDCTKYIPEIGRTVRIPCADAFPPAPTAPATATETEAVDDRANKVMLGLTLTVLTSDLRDKFKVAPTIDGVLVADVDAGSEAAGRGIKRGDVIMQTNQGVVATPADVVRMIVSAKTSGRKSLLLLLKNSGGEAVFVALPLGMTSTAARRCVVVATENSERNSAR